MAHLGHLRSRKYCLRQLRQRICRLDGHVLAAQCLQVIQECAQMLHRVLTLFFSSAFWAASSFASRLCSDANATGLPC